MTLLHEFIFVFIQFFNMEWEKKCKKSGWQYRKGVVYRKGIETFCTLC